MRRHTNLTVASVLSIDALWGAEVLAGHRGLNNRVGGVNIIEVADVTRWLHGSEFLLSSAHLWRDRPDDMCGLIADLDDAGVAALGHKPTSHTPRLSAKVLETAEERGFPIVQLPPELAYRDVLESVYMLLFGHHRSSVGPDMAARLGLDPNDHSMAESVRRLGLEFAEEVEVVDQMDGLVHHVTSTGQMTSAPIVTHDPATASGSEGLRPNQDPERIASGRRVSWVAPLVVDGTVQGRLEIADTADRVDLATVMDVADLLSLLQLRRRAYRQGLHGALDLTFRALARGTLAPDEIADRAQLLGLREHLPWQLSLVSLRGPDVTAAALAQLRQSLDHQLPSDVTVLVADPTELCLVLLVRRGDTSIARLVDDVRAGAGAVLGSTPSVHTGTAPSATTIHGIPEALRQARIALDVAVARGREENVCFTDLGAEAVLAQVACGDVARAFIARRLDNIDDPELLRTLEVYIACQGNKSATASAIPMHRSGLVYRLKKISALIGADLDDPEIMNELWLALKLQRVSAVGS